MLDDQSLTLFLKKIDNVNFIWNMFNDLWKILKKISNYNILWLKKRGAHFLEITLYNRKSTWNIGNAIIYNIIVNAFHFLNNLFLRLFLCR